MSEESRIARARRYVAIAAGLGGLAAVAWACGPGVSGSCPNSTPGNATLAQNASLPQEGADPDLEKAAAVAAAPKASGSAAGAASAGPATSAAAGAAAPSGSAAAGAAPAAAPAAATFNVKGLTKSGSKPAAFAVVYLLDAPKDPTRGMKATIDQRMMMFLPYVAVVAEGGTVNFMNSDPFPHNVFSPSGEKFDLGTIPKGGGGRRVFKAPGAYTLLCNVHPGMIGYVYVTPSNYFAISDGRGQFTIKQVPEGNYRITAWAPKQTTQPQPVVVKGADATIELTLEKQ